MFKAKTKEKPSDQNYQLNIRRLFELARIDVLQKQALRQSVHRPTRLESQHAQQTASIAKQKELWVAQNRRIVPMLAQTEAEKLALKNYHKFNSYYQE